MKAIDFLKINREILKLMSKCDLRMTDFNYVELWNDYASMLRDKEKVSYILYFLSKKYGASESTIKRIIKRFNSEVSP